MRNALVVFAVAALFFVFAEQEHVISSDGDVVSGDVESEVVVDLVEEFVIEAEPEIVFEENAYPDFVQEPDEFIQSDCPDGVCEPRMVHGNCPGGVCYPPVQSVGRGGLLRRLFRR